jgi:death on curing protein
MRNFGNSTRSWPNRWLSACTLRSRKFWPFIVNKIEEYGGDPGIKDKALLESAVFPPHIGYYTGVLEEAAALMDSLVNQHPFLDETKRVGFAAADTFLTVNGYDLDIEAAMAFDFVMVALSKGEFRFGTIQEWLGTHFARAMSGVQTSGAPLSVAPRSSKQRRGSRSLSAARWLGGCTYGVQIRDHPGRKFQRCSAQVFTKMRDGRCTWDQ